MPAAPAKALAVQKRTENLFIKTTRLTNQLKFLWKKIKNAQNKITLRTILFYKKVEKLA
jgi:hypothetical protein